MKYSKTSLYTLVTVLLFSLLTACSVSEHSDHKEKLHDSTNSLGISEERLSRIDSMLLNQIEENNIPGAVAIVSYKGKTVYHKAFGKSNVAESVDFNTDDIFRLASMSKAIISTGLMILWEDGMVGLDDPVEKYIPEFAETGILDTFNEADSSYTLTPVESKMTIRQLLTHSSGIGYGGIDPDPRYTKIYRKLGIIEGFSSKDLTIEENVKRLAKAPLHFEPGTQTIYSMGIDVVGRIIEVASGKPLDVFLKERVFDPIGMNDTRFYFSDERSERLVPIQTKKDGEWVTVNNSTDMFDPNYPINGAKKLFSGGAGLSGTAEDYMKFIQMYTNGGSANGNQVLSPTTIRTILTAQTGDVWPDPNAGHGLAFMVFKEGSVKLGGPNVPGTFTWGGYFNTSYFGNMEHELVGVIMKQTYQTGDQASNLFSRMVFSSIQ